MNEMALQFLIACDESITRRRPILAELAALHNVRPDELFYLWAERRCQQRGSLGGGEWLYFFHGIECDLRHAQDGRFLRLDFGPHGITDAFTPWGAAQFIMTSKSPWPEFNDLKTYLADHAPPYDEYAASMERAGKLCDCLEEAGLIETADPELLVLAERHPSPNAEGLPTLRLPPGTPERTSFDIMVANRKVISDAGRKLLSSQAREALVQG
jgi:hypothetical protein